jgi:hypothetical protein
MQMNFKKFKESLRYRKYSKIKILIRFFEYKIKDFIIDLTIKLNLIKFGSKPFIDLGSFKDNRFINFIFFSLKNDFIFLYRDDENAKKLFKRIGFLNFFKHTNSNSSFINEKKIRLSINSKSVDSDEISFNTNYFKYFYNENKDTQKKLIMPYYMYPRIYNSFYNKISIKKEPDFNLRIFFSGSIVDEGYGFFKWDKDPTKFPNRIKIINTLLKEFKNEIFLIKTKKDLKSSDISKKKIIFCLHDKMIKKTSYTLNFKENFNLLKSSCFNLSCPGVVMPLCHHLIEGIKVGSIPITNCEKLLFPNLDKDISLHYSSLDQLIIKMQEALVMKSDEIIFKREKVLNYYKSHLSPESFRLNFLNMLSQKEREIICCDDHRSVDRFIAN